MNSSQSLSTARSIGNQSVLLFSESIISSSNSMLVDLFTEFFKLIKCDRVDTQGGLKRYIATYSITSWSALLVFQVVTLIVKFSRIFMRQRVILIYAKKLKLSSSLEMKIFYNTFGLFFCCTICLIKVKWVKDGQNICKYVDCLTSAVSTKSKLNSLITRIF